MKRAVVLFLCAAAVATRAVADVGFVACPIYRDTVAGRKSGCWLADDPATGIRYDVTSGPTKPDWNFAVLVEGKAQKGDENPCGGIVLDPVRVSVLETRCTRYMLGGEGFAGRKFVLPRRNVRPLYDRRAAAMSLPHTRSFSIPFDFDSDFVTYQLSDYYLDQAIQFALDVAARRIVITGVAQVRPIQIGDAVLVEPAALADARAKKVRDAFVARGISAARIFVAVQSGRPADLDPFDGLIGPQDRRVDVSIDP